MIFATKSLKHPGTITETLIVLYINNRPLKAIYSHYRSTDDSLGVFLTEHVCEIPKHPSPAHMMINNTLHAGSLHDPLLSLNFQFFNTKAPSSCDDRQQAPNLFTP